MNFLNKLERRFGKFYIRNLMLIIIVGNAFVYLLTTMKGNREFANNISLIPEAVMNGEVWRLVTFIFVPENTSVIWIIFTLYFYYLAGSGLEQEWGGFKFNIYYLIGMLASIIFSFLTGFPVIGSYVNLSLFLAFAKIYPDLPILLFFIIPVKIKYIAIFNWVIIGFNFVTAGSLKAMLLVLIPVINYLLFFGKDIITGSKNNAINYRRQQNFKAQIKEKEMESFHKCIVCGITEKEDPKMEFRYCSKCSDKACYCINHIRDHEHRYDEKLN